MPGAYFGATTVLQALEDYWRRNEDEELTARDAWIKLDGPSERTVAKALQRLVRDGYLVSRIEPVRPQRAIFSRSR